MSNDGLNCARGGLPGRPATPPGAVRPDQRHRVAPYSAAGLAFASAAVSIYWTLGGTRLLDTVGGTIEEFGRERSLPAIFVGTTAALLKVALGALAVALGRNAPARHGRRLLLPGAVASGVLIVWGGANVLAGALVLSDVIVPSTPVDERALRWHVFVWDLWFVVWGVSLAIAVEAHRRPTYARPPSKGRL